MRPTLPRLPQVGWPALIAPRGGSYTGYVFSSCSGPAGGSVCGGMGRGPPQSRRHTFSLSLAACVSHTRARAATGRVVAVATCGGGNSFLHAFQYLDVEVGHLAFGHFPPNGAVHTVVSLLGRLPKGPALRARGSPDTRHVPHSQWGGASSHRATRCGGRAPGGRGEGGWWCGWRWQRGHHAALGTPCLHRALVDGSAAWPGGAR